MSTSRLEKFIYAICSMEVSDLPAPLSRIEILWNCLITGETPDFEPQSRNEQYLMAMLGLYELENLPTPISRGEKLLYKIAVGETDLSDVPAYLSRYEELLKYLIENGGVGDFEYILQTLNQRLNTLYSTKERPVKSAILSGNTLVNLVSRVDKNYFGSLGTITPTFNTSSNFISTIMTYPANNTDKKGAVCFKITRFLQYAYNTDLIGLKGKTFTLLATIENGTNSNINIILSENGYNTANGYTITTISSKTSQNIKTTFTVGDTNLILGHNTILASSPEYCSMSNIVIVEGEFTNQDIPYFEGMQSVKMPVLTTTGKNLFDINFINTIYSNFNNSATVKIDNNSFTMTSSANNRSYLVQNKPIILKPNTVYTLSLTGYSTGNYRRINIGSSNGVDKNDYKSITLETNEATYSTRFRTNKSGHVYINFYPTTSAESLTTISNIQLEEGSTATSYEPYKSNILTVNEDVTLHGIGEVQDTLDCLTGEVVKKTGVETLDEDSNWSNVSLYDNVVECAILGTDIGQILISDTIPIGYGGDIERVCCVNGNIFVAISKTKLTSYDLIGIKNYLKTNPINILYSLNQSTVKTVDLTTVDQDGQPTQLKTFNDITHVELSSEGLIPEVELEVATKINETLLTMSPQHHDISETQNKLGQTIDEQTENTDAAMLATTEIYEQTL